MRRILILLAVILVLLLASPLLTGHVSEGQLRIASEKFAQKFDPIGSVATVYRRGWLNSDVENELLVEDDDFFARVLLKTRVMHGPVIFGGGDPELPVVDFALATTRTTMTIFYGDDRDEIEIPGALYTRLGIDRSNHLWGFFEPINRVYNESDGETFAINWGGARFDARANSDLTMVEGAASSKPFEMTGANGTLGIGQIELASAAKLSEFGFWLGDSSMTVASMGLSNLNSDVDKTSVEDIRLTAHSDQVDGQVSANADISIARFHGNEIGDVSFSLPFSFSRIDAESLGRLQAATDQLSQFEAPDPVVALQVQEAMLGLLAKGIAINVPGSELRTNQGNARVEFALDLPAAGGQDQAALMAALFTMTGRASLRIDQALLELLSRDNPPLQQQIVFLLQTGTLVEQETDVVLDASFENGLLTINGTPVPFPMPAPPGETL